MAPAPPSAVPLARRCSPRTVLALASLCLCLVLLTGTFCVDVCEVSTGSMAPALVGRHRAASCPRCGALCVVGVHPGEKDPVRQARTFRRAHCWNCGCTDLGLDSAAPLPGRRILVDRTAFLWRQPRRWEVVVFRLFGFVFIKRVIGLPGETVEIKDGDVWIDGELCRKTLAQLLEVRIPVFDSSHWPSGVDGRQRWVVYPADSGHIRKGAELHLDGSAAEQPYQAAAYRQFFWEEQKSAPIRDEYSYNGNQCLPTRDVHDFLVECDVAVEQGEGTFSLHITDGADTAAAEIPITSRASAIPWSQLTAHQGASTLAAFDMAAASEEASVPARVLFRPRNCYHVQMAFVDRRAIVRVGSAEAMLDLPGADQREAVTYPVTLAVRHAKVVVRNFRLFRDVYYTQAGRNGVRGKPVPLAAGQYFVMGDNSPVSEDSRFWPGQGAVPAANLIGRPLRIPLPGF